MYPKPYLEQVEKGLAAAFGDMKIIKCFDIWEKYGQRRSQSFSDICITE